MLLYSLPYCPPYFDIFRFSLVSFDVASRLSQQMMWLPGSLSKNSKNTRIADRDYYTNCGTFEHLANTSNERHLVTIVPRITRASATPVPVTHDGEPL